MPETEGTILDKEERKRRRKKRIKVILAIIIGVIVFIIIMVSATRAIWLEATSGVFGWTKKITHSADYDSMWND